MKVLVCVRQSVNGEINPFDACAYEAALRIEGAEVTLLSMGPNKAFDFLKGLTRLGAKRAVLLSDPAFAGADTLATAYTLSLAVKKLRPDLIICGRQTVDGDTGQVGPELSIFAGYNFAPNVMELSANENSVEIVNRSSEKLTVKYPALITVERINTLRLPSIRSKVGEVEVWNADGIDADLLKCGLNGSPTKVLKTFENLQDRRKCKFIAPNKLWDCVDEALIKQNALLEKTITSKHISKVFIIGDSPFEMARTISNDITVIPMDTPEKIAEIILEKKPNVVLWGSDPQSKMVAPQVAAILKLGLCADCTSLETDGREFYMYRPAFSGNIIAKIVSTTRPAMATVRTVQPENSELSIGVGMGAKDYIKEICCLARDKSADIAATRLIVDHDFLPYINQVGLTGRTVSPKVYLALGISGAVHHIAGIRSSETIIAVNNDRNAEIFNYADFGVVADIKDIL